MIFRRFSLQNHPGRRSQKEDLHAAFLRFKARLGTVGSSTVQRMGSPRKRDLSDLVGMLTSHDSWSCKCSGYSFHTSSYQLVRSQGTTDLREEGWLRDIQILVQSPKIFRISKHITLPLN